VSAKPLRKNSSDNARFKASLPSSRNLPLASSRFGTRTLRKCLFEGDVYDQAGAAEWNALFDLFVPGGERKRPLKQ